MSRSLSYLRRGLLGIAFVGSLGFGATQAFATPQVAAGGAYCDWAYCAWWCSENVPGSDGLCSTRGECQCI